MVASGSLSVVVVVAVDGVWSLVDHRVLLLHSMAMASGSPSVFVAVDGVWAAWQEWGECSTTCSNGTHDRYRNCTEPKYGGAPCPGNDTDTEGCFPRECPGNGADQTLSAVSRVSVRHVAVFILPFCS